MSEFSLVPLGQLAEIRMGQSPDSTYVYEGSEQGVPFLQGNAEFGVKHPAAKYSCTQPAKIAEQGSSLISVRAPVGETNIADQLYCIGRGLAAVKFHRYGASLGRELLSFSAKSLDKVSQGTTFAAIGGADLRTLLVADIPSQEAKVLERVLDTLDAQIQQTEAMIAKLEKVKEGLLHDLLTRGIDENGQLRPSPEQAPELYKESPLGLIPREWELQSLGDIAHILHGYAFEGEFFSDKPEGKRLLTPGNFHRNGGLYFELGNSKWFTGKVPSGYVLGDGDAVTVMTDLSPKTLILGRAVVLDEGEDILHNQRIGKISLRDQSANFIDFVVLAINSQSFRRQVIAEATGTTVRHTSPERMKSVKIATPPKAEQLRIDSVYRATKTKVGVERSTLQKLIYEKVSLMDDLLTGRVRVTPLLDQTQATTPA